MSSENKNESITRQSEDFAQWYTDVCKKASLMSYSPVKGFINYLPYGYALWEGIQHYLDPKFKKIGTQNVYLPLVIPQSLFSKEKKHVEGFAPECLVATFGGGNKLADPLIIRPTSEVLFSELFKNMASSYRDLPILLNQWCSVVRWEKTTRPFLRGSEFLWQEGHCLFENEEQARKNALEVLEIYDQMGRDYLAIPFIKGIKTPYERFAGANDTYCIEALMPDGKSLQAGTTHDLGNDFAKAASIQYLGRNNKLETPYTTSWGVSTRLIGATIMVHGDDNGLILPPKIAPIQVVIVPIRQETPGLLEQCVILQGKLLEQGIRVHTDDSDKTPGWKYNEYEMKGVPLRIEVGPRDLQNGTVMISKRYNGEKVSLPLDKVASLIPELLEDIHKKMYQKALDFLASHTKDVHSKEELLDALDKGYFARGMWDGTEETELALKEASNGGTIRCILFEQEHIDEADPFSGNKAEKLVIYAKAY